MLTDTEGRVGPRLYDGGRKRREDGLFENSKVGTRERNNTGTRCGKDTEGRPYIDGDGCRDPSRTW